MKNPIDGCMTIPFYEKANHVLTTAHVNYSSIMINPTDDKYIYIYMSLSQNKLLLTYYPQLMAEFQIMILFWIPISSNKWYQFWMSICLISIHVFFSVLDHHFWPPSMSLNPHGHLPVLTLIERYIHYKPSKLGKSYKSYKSYHFTNLKLAAIWGWFYIPY